MAANPYPTLFSPVQLGSLVVKNRIAMAPMGNRLPTSAGYVTQDLIDYYLARARGGVGLIIFQFTAVSLEGNVSPRIPLLSDDSFIPGLRRMVDQLHEAGAKVAIQLAHGGAISPSAVTGARPKAPSNVGWLQGEIPSELSVAEIEKIIEDFGQAGRRAKEAGFDAIEVHGTHGYLVNQFLSPIFNRRQDEWGGDVQRRARFAVEIIKRTRDHVGSDYPIIVRYPVDEFVPGGITLEDGQVTAQILEQAGASALNLTGGAQETAYMWTPPMPLAYGVHAPLGEAVKRVVRIPVMLVGRIHDPAVAEDLLTSGKADVVTLGRQILADPDFARKAEEGRADEIRPCLACTASECHGRLFKGLPLGCVVNPVLAREGQFPMTPTDAPKKVLVVGGGPAGMEAARTAATRGHHVTLLEESDQLGGVMKIGCVPPHKDSVRRLTDYYRRQLELAKVQVRTNCAADPDLITSEEPDVVVVATGGRPLIPDIAGVPENTVSAWDILAGKAQAGDRVAIIGGGEVSCEVAEYLAEQGKQVTVIEMLPDIAPNLLPAAKALLLQAFQKYAVDYVTSASVVAVDADGFLTVAFGETQHRMGPFDSVVLSVGVAPRTELVEQLKGTRLDVRPIGDCVKPRTLAEAIREGFEVAYSL